jgi:hypothetical protein
LFETKNYTEGYCTLFAQFSWGFLGFLSGTFAKIAEKPMFSLVKDAFQDRCNKPLCHPSDFFAVPRNDYAFA